MGSSFIELLEARLQHLYSSSVHMHKKHRYKLAMNESSDFFHQKYQQVCLNGENAEFD